MIPIELLLACDKNTLRNLLNTCHDINKLADEHFWKLRTNDIQTDETWLKSYKRLTINYGSVNGKNNIIKHIDNYYLTVDHELFKGDKLIFEHKVRDFFVDVMIVVLTQNNNLFQSRSTTKINFKKIAKGASKLFYSQRRNDIFYTDSQGTYRIGDSYHGYKIEKFLDIEVLDLYVKPDNELMGRIYSSWFITKDGEFGSGFISQLTIKKSETKFIGLSMFFNELYLLDNSFNLYYSYRDNFKKLSRNVAKLFCGKYLTKDDKLYCIDKEFSEKNGVIDYNIFKIKTKLLAENVVNFHADEYIIKIF